jgi:hypothetical protein
MEPGPAGEGRADIFVGSADDPEGPRVPVNPSGTGSFGFWEVLDRQMLFEACRGLTLCRPAPESPSRSNNDSLRRTNGLWVTTLP